MAFLIPTWKRGSAYAMISMDRQFGQKMLFCKSTTLFNASTRPLPDLELTGGVWVFDEGLYKGAGRRGEDPFGDEKAIA